MRRTLIIVLVTLVATATAAPSSSDSSAGHVKDDIENLRDLINPDKKGNKKPRKYKCIVIEEGDDDEVIADKLTNNNIPQMDKNKFVFIEADDQRKNMVITATEATTASVAPAPAPVNQLRFQQHGQQQYQPPQQQGQHLQYPPQQQYRPQPPQQPQRHQQAPPQQQQQQSSSFLQSQTDFEKITEEEAAVEYPPLQPQQQQQYQERLVTLPPAPPPQPSAFQQQSSSPNTRPQLKQIHLPKAHSFNAAARNNFPAAQIQTTLPPEIANAPRDAQNRPLILAPEHCKQVKHYANMYGVSDVRGWVHNNCSFAQTYLPTASCEEIDILVASCYRNLNQ